MQKPVYDYQLVLKLQKKCNGRNVHTVNTLLSQYDQLFSIAEDAGEYTFLLGHKTNIYNEIHHVHARMVEVSKVH